MKSSNKLTLLMIFAVMIGCGHGSSGGSGITGNNVLSITVNGSLCSTSTSAGYLNKACISVTICNPGTSTCQTIDDILLDTGSFGLRIFKQALTTVSLTQVLSGSGGSLAECAQFGDGSALWGPVQMAGITLANEPTVTVPIQVIDSTFANISTSTICPGAEQSPVAAGFNGILGVGVFPEDWARNAHSLRTSEYITPAALPAMEPRFPFPVRSKIPLHFSPWTITA